MKYNLFFYSFILLFIFSCQFNKQENNNNIFSDLTNSVSELLLQEGKNIHIQINDIPPRDSFLFTSEISLIDTIYGVKLETTEESIIGIIDKIRINKNAIYVLDRYKTKSVKRFSMEGDFLNPIGKHGNGPGEYIEPTDFYVDEKEIIIYDQFQQKFLFFSLQGTFIKEKTAPFYFLQFHKFDENNYLIRGLDSDNYHLPEILDYSLWSCDSTFTINKRGISRKQNKYINIWDKNNLQHFNNTLYFRESCTDTVFSISPEGILKYDFSIDFGKKTPPKELFYRSNSKKQKKERREKSNYTFSSEYAVTDNYFYYTFTIKTLVYHFLYSISDQKSYCFPCMINDINFIFPFQQIYETQNNTLISYISALHLYQQYHYRTEEEWLNMKNSKGEDHSAVGKQVIEFCKDLHIDDNPIILFYILKDNGDNN